MAPRRRKLDLVGATEIAELLGLSRARVHQLAKEPGFPEPAAVLRQGIIWHRDDVVAWARRTRALPTDPD